eukprot:1790782-Rhodomonas_salina.1
MTVQPGHASVSGSPHTRQSQPLRGQHVALNFKHEAAGHAGRRWSLYSLTPADTAAVSPRICSFFLHATVTVTGTATGTVTVARTCANLSHALSSSSHLRQGRVGWRASTLGCARAARRSAPACSPREQASE